jgi:pantoate--beta-alanine ligase
MKIIKSASDLKQERDQLTGTVGLVPTMGNLHRGHLTLVRRALEEHQHCVVSIFVNPTQFGPGEDLESYPRTLEQDCQQLKKLETTYQKEILVFAPQSAKEVYPESFSTTISNSRLASELEGRFRPTHFEGVCTVVYRLFRLVRPDSSYFGQKDYQQFIIIHQMVRDLELPIDLVKCPIIRDEDGLAFSSRNQYLSKEQRIHALTLPKTLEKLEEIFIQQGVDACQSQINSLLQEDEAWDYLEIREANTLKPIDAITDSKLKRFVLLAVYRLGQTRLLDNREVERA